MSKTSVVIVGSGCYGLSTALWMLEGGKYEVTVVDKNAVLPAPDAASTDLNKVVRAGDYDDPTLAALTLDAVEHWKKPEWKGTFHQSGLVGYERGGDSQFDHSTVVGNLANHGVKADVLTSPQQIIDTFGGAPVATFEGCTGYHNPIGGWAEAGRAMEVAIERIKSLGGKVIPGWEFSELVTEGKKCLGVKSTAGEQILADLTLICTGAWTPAVLKKVIPERSGEYDIVATGQSIAMIQLDEEEQKIYAKIPVVMTTDTGFYMFPPNPTGIVKVAIHGGGITNVVDSTGVSVPRTKLTPGAESGAIPKDMLVELRAGLADIYPELARKPFVDTRLCWYADSSTGDWVIDFSPDYENLVIASGDSGHAFKFAPVIGREILALIEGTLNPVWKEKWKFETAEAALANKSKSGADHRVTPRGVLKVEELITTEDLAA